MVFKKVSEFHPKKDYELFLKDFHLSTELKSMYNSLIKIGECYTNIWNIFSKTNYLQTHENIRIAYGYVNCPEVKGLYLRHCFFIDSNNKIIDPTLADENFCTYYIVMSFSTSEYRNILIDFPFTDFANYLPYIEANKEFIKWGWINEIVTIG